jgi:predicted DNA-binding transcriptional regulator YafY
VERYLQPLLPVSTMAYLSPWFRTANGVLDSHGNGLSGWRNKVRVLASGQPLQPPTVDSDIQSVLTQALLQDKRVSITYRPRGAKINKEYVANPLGLVVRDQVIYLVCTLWEYPDIKQFVFSRMRSATLLDESITRPKDFDLDSYIAQGEFGWPVESPEKIDLIVDFNRGAAINIIEQPLERNQKIEEINAATVRLTARVQDTYELRRWLQTYGDQVEVLAPASLRKELAKVAANLMARYS